METFILEDKIDYSICDDLISYHKENKEYKHHGGTKGGTDKTAKDSIDVNFFNESTDTRISNYFHALEEVFTKYMKKYGLEQHIILQTEGAHNIQYYQPNGGFKVWHTERMNLESSKRQLVYMTYLNDVTDGGETEFYWQKLKVKAEKGKTIIWPSDFTHTHRGIISPTQEKYIVTGWFEYAS